MFQIGLVISLPSCPVREKEAIMPNSYERGENKIWFGTDYESSSVVPPTVSLFIGLLEPMKRVAFNLN